MSVTHWRQISLSQIHYDTCLASIDQRTPTSILREKWIQENYAHIFKVTENAISFLGRRNATQIKSPRHWTRNDSLIYLSFVDNFFLDNIFLIMGSLMNACERELKLSNNDNENISGKCNLTLSFCNHFWINRMFEVTHLACWVSLCYPGVKFHTQILNCLEKKRKLSKN